MSQLVFMFFKHTLHDFGSIKTSMHVHGLILIDSSLAAVQRFMLCAHKNKYEFKHSDILLVRMLGFSQKLLKFDYKIQNLKMIQNFTFPH
jgi:hypothetical protein